MGLYKYSAFLLGPWGSLGMFHAHKNAEQYALWTFTCKVALAQQTQNFIFYLENHIDIVPKNDMTSYSHVHQLYLEIKNFKD